MKGVMQFGKKGLLSQQYVESYEVFELIDKVAYRLNLPSKMATVVTHSTLESWKPERL